ncbi:Chaperone protein DnaJ [Smittium mucronatum]|uniref:Chaperone protein DnaJ n=1 Tax=Smittium mucronatum TaxID=133383 RepID=A0A1R0H2G4_9FUNG|nr:Chaperone protein DnaJ [Smittium mucronatum]
MKFIFLFFLGILLLGSVLGQGGGHAPPEGRKTVDMEILELMAVVKDQHGTLDWYFILGVGEDARESTINRAYRLYSRRNHPDKFVGEEKDRLEFEEKFKNVGLIVNTLKDPMRRGRYDYFRFNGFPISTRKIKIEFLNFSTSFYFFWSYIPMIPLVIFMTTIILELAYAFCMYELAQNTLRYKKPGVSEEIPVLPPFKRTLTDSEVAARLAHIESLDKFNSVFSIENPQDITPPSLNSFFFYRFISSRF